MIRTFRNMFVAVLAALAIIMAGLVFNSASATQATFYVKGTADQGIQAKATAVAIAGANAIGKQLLEEVRAITPQNVQKRMQPPTKAQQRKYGTLVHSNAEAQAVLNQQVPVYDKIVNKAKVKVAKLKVRLKYAHSHKDKRKLKKALKAAQHHLKQVLVDSNWKYRPLIGLPEGVCGRNTGANDLLNVTSFVECVGQGNDHHILWLGFDPVTRELRVVASINKDGTLHAGCLNFFYFVIPPGTPDESMFIVLRSFAQAVAIVSVDYNANIALTMAGDLTCPDGYVVHGEKTVTFAAPTQHLTKTVVSPHSTDEAIAFGEKQASVDTGALATAKAKVAENYAQTVSGQITLVCPNEKPTGEIVAYPKHLYVGDEFRAKVVGSDPEDGANVNVSYTMTGAAHIQVDADHPQNCDAEGTSQACTFYIVADQTPGNATLTLVVTDSEGAQFTESWTFPVLPEEL